MTPYPLLFEPILKARVWGGRSLEALGKRLPPNELIGESWELADLSASIPGGRSVVANGELAGRTLRQAIVNHRDAIAGAAKLTADGGFPLLIKYLDARENLSVQVHPSPAYAARHPDAHLKSEAWMIVSAKPGAVIYKGVKPHVAANDFRNHIEQGTVVDDLVAVPVKAGECHYLPSGTCHALGAGIVVAEIQTPSDTTFRVYDWGRGASSRGGGGRELHVAQALECIRFGGPSDKPQRLHKPIEVQGVRTTALAATEYFEIDRVDAISLSRFPIETSGLPEVWMMIEGLGRIETANAPRVDLESGTTALVPAGLADSFAVLGALGVVTTRSVALAVEGTDRLRRTMVLGPRHSRLLTLVGLTVVLLLTGPVEAVQHLVKPGEDWQRLATKVRPGDEIVLLPGQHRPAAFDRLAGSDQRPIVIRSADESNPSIIKSEREGIKIKQAAHLVIKNLTISGGTVSGLSISAAGPAATDSEAKRPGSIVIQRLVISKIGPKGQRHAMLFTGLDNVRIEDCQIEGWGGSGIELVSCRDVIISRCWLSGLQDHTQLNGIRARAGSERINIDRCRMENAGDRVFSFGGASDLAEFNPAIPAQTETSKVAEVARMTVERCIISGGRCVFAFVNADDCLARNNTIMRPRYCVIGLLNEQKDPRFTPGHRNIFGYNITVWEAGEMKRLAEVGANTAPDKFLLERNVWWSGETGEELKKLGPLPGTSHGEQTMDVNPKLNADLKPTNAGIDGFGA